MGKAKYYKVYDEQRRFTGNIPIEKIKTIDTDSWLATVSCFVVNKNNEILVEKRVNKGLTPGELDLCSGHIDEEEIPTQAMIRELREELGIPIDEAMNAIKITKNSCPLIQASGKKRRFFVDFYCLKLRKMNNNDITFDPKEVDSISWYSMEEVFELIRTGKTRFPANYDYESIFQRVRDISLGVRSQDSIER